MGPRRGSRANLSGLRNPADPDRFDPMRNKCLIAFLAVLVIVIVAAVIFAYRFDLSALPEPGPRETRMANAARHWLISRAARSVPADSGTSPASVAAGRMYFLGECANCHGTDGRTPTEIGRWMYPRALDLSSPEVQGWSDRELFWIIKNGVRLSGMPGFGKVFNDTQVWQLVGYVRSMKPQPQQ
jgi:mono/diheme cytochrome c family protein